MLGSQPMRSPSVVIWLNGQHASVAEGSTLFSLLESLDLSGKRLAVELNGEIVTRAVWVSTLLSTGDRVEIVHAIGGG